MEKENLQIWIKQEIKGPNNYIKEKKNIFCNIMIGFCRPEMNLVLDVHFGKRTTSCWKIKHGYVYLYS